MIGIVILALFGLDCFATCCRTYIARTYALPFVYIVVWAWLVAYLLLLYVARIYCEKKRLRFRTIIGNVLGFEYKDSDVYERNLFRNK